MITVTKLTPQEQVEKAENHYIWHIDRAHFHNDIIDACQEYIATLKKIIEAETGS